MNEKISRVLLSAAVLAGTVAAQSPTPPPAPPPATVTPSSILPGTAAAPNPILRFAKLSPLGDSPDWSKLQAFAKTMTRPELEAALKEIYTDNSTLPAA